MMTSKKLHETKDPRAGWCPIYDMPCPQGEKSASLCAQRFDEDYNPMTNLRDAAMTFCAIQRQEEGFGVQSPDEAGNRIRNNINQSFFQDGEME